MNTHTRIATTQLKSASIRTTAFAALMAAILLAPTFPTGASAQGNGGGGGGGGGSGGEGGNGGGYSLNYGNVPNVFSNANDPGQHQGRNLRHRDQDKAGACIGRRHDCGRP